MVEAFNAVKKNVGSLPIYPKPNDEEEEVLSERGQLFWFSFEEEEAQRRRICCLFFLVRFYDENHVDARKSPKSSREI